MTHQAATDPHRAPPKPRDKGTAHAVAGHEKRHKSTEGKRGLVGAGATITGATVQTTSVGGNPANYFPGIVYDAAGLRAYNSGGVITMQILASDGSISVFGSGTITGATIQTSASNPRIVMDGASGTPGFRVYNSSGVPTFNVDLNSNTITVGSTTTITGGTIQTATSGARVVMDGSGLRAYDSVNNVINIDNTGAFTLTKSGASITVASSGVTISSAAGPTSGARIIIDSTGIKGWNSTDALGSPHLIIDSTSGLITCTGVITNQPGSTVPWQTTGFFIGGGNLLPNGSAEDPTTTTQVLYMSTGASVTAGTLTLTYDGTHNTGALNWNATAGQVQTALQGLTALGTNVTCSGGPLPGTPITITIANLGVAPAVIQIASQSLTGGTVICGGLPTGWIYGQGTADVFQLGSSYHGGSVFRLTANAGSAAPYIVTPNMIGPLGLVPGTSYTQSAYFKAPTATRLPFMQTYIRDISGQNMSAFGSNSVVNTSGTWQRLVSTGQIPPVGTKQTISITGAPTSGSFKLTYNGQQTASINWNAPATGVGSVAAALEALSNVGVGGVTEAWCTGGPLPGTPISIVFTYPTVVGEATPALMTHTDSLTGGTSPAVHIADVPPNYLFALLGVAGAANGEVFYVDAAQLECGDAATSFAPRPDEILANTVQANMVNVANLSAISANLGTITAGTITGTIITGGTVQTASGTGVRVVMSGSSNQLQVFDSGNTMQVSLDGVNGLRFQQGTGTLQSLEWFTGSTKVGQLYSAGNSTDSNASWSVNDSSLIKTATLFMTTSTAGPTGDLITATAGGGGPVAIIRGDGASSFMQLATGTSKNVIAFGTTTLTWTASNLSGTISVSHGLGRTPSVVVACANQAPAPGEVPACNPSSIGSSTFNLNGDTRLSFTGTCTVSWIAIG